MSTTCDWIRVEHAQFASLNACVCCAACTRKSINYASTMPMVGTLVLFIVMLVVLYGDINYVHVRINILGNLIGNYWPIIDTSGHCTYMYM